MQLNKKTAIVTGASSGLGMAIAEALVNKNVKVYGLARNLAKLNAQQEKLGKNFVPVEMDISDKESLTKWITDTFSENNCPEILINNAGVGGYSKVDEIPTWDWLNMVNTNLNGVFYITSHFVSMMKKKQGSKYIINIGSILGTIGNAEASAYCATKFAISGFSEALFKELREFDIKVSVINPGSIETDFFKDSGVEAHHNMLQPKDLADTVVYLLETPDNMLINELTVRPLHPKKPV